MKIGKMEVGYTTDIGKPYQLAIDKAESLAELRKITLKYYPFAWDADKVVSQMTNADFERFKRAVAKERKGKFQSKDFDLTGPILMPEPMLAFGLVAETYKVPDGCAVIRMLDMGLLTLEDDKIIVSDKMKGSNSPTLPPDVTRK